MGFIVGKMLSNILWKTHVFIHMFQLFPVGIAVQMVFMT